jgi:4-amino-4-deoxy-L-arabinose transferase-like glycosyltransferase
MALLSFLLIAWVLIGAGRTIASILRVPARVAVLEKNLIGYAIGLVLFAYGMLVIGLLKGLYPPVAIGWLVVLLLVGVVQYPSMGREAVSILATCFHPQRIVWLMMAVLAVFNVISLVGCFAPPIVGAQVLQSIYTEYDSIAYHLADPKLYISAHRIYPIYWEHHSNFAFTGEMWYTFGLLFHSIALAKLFHWSCGLAASLAIYRLAVRSLGQRAAVVAVILFASTPLVFWEAGTAYVDLIATYFTTLTLLALAVGMAGDSSPSSVGTGAEERGVVGSSEAWLRLSAVLMGLTLSSKATAVTTLALLAVALLYWRAKVRKQPIGSVLGQVAVWCVIALVVGCPWYVKSIAYTGNPIYPFYFQIFGGKFWNHQNAVAYDASNAAFGLGHQPANLLLAPWNLVTYLMPGHPAPLYPMLGPRNKGTQPFNNFPTELGTLSPVLLAALFVPAFLRLSSGESRKTEGALIQGLSLFALASFLLWFATMQYARYLLPFYPVLCILAGWGVDRALALRTITGWALAVFTALSVAVSGYIGLALAQYQLPVATGRQPVAQYVTDGYRGYPAMQFINDQLPADSKVVFYGNPLGFYCDKPYLWGEPGHSTFIPYDKMKSANDLLAYFQSTHVTHVLIDTRGFDWPPSTQSEQWVQWLYQLTGGRSQPVFEQRGFVIYQVPGAHS